MFKKYRWEHALHSIMDFEEEQTLCVRITVGRLGKLCACVMTTIFDVRYDMLRIPCEFAQIFVKERGELKIEDPIMIAKAWLAVALCYSVTCAGARRGPHHPRGAHRHSRPERGAVLTRDDEVLHDTKHIEEDTAALTPEQLAKMSPQELEFHYFSAHDFDRNSKLDGLEMLKAVYHTMEHEDDNPESESSIEPGATELEGFIALVDRTLATDDTDNDGYVSYAEYRAARLERDRDARRAEDAPD